jgi:ribosome-associated protein
MAIEVTPDLIIPDGDYAVAFIRSGGPGGQNVNKVASAVQLRFDLAGSRVLAEDVRARLRRLGGQRVNDDGSLLIVAREHRSQDQNRRDAEQRLAALIRQALIAPKPRRATRPTRASRLRRLDTKSQRSSTKRGRGRPRLDD